MSIYPFEHVRDSGRMLHFSKGDAVVGALEADAVLQDRIYQLFEIHTNSSC